MLKKLLSLVAITCSFSALTGFAQQVPNDSFESWANDLASVPDPVSWGTANILNFTILGSSPVSVTKNTSDVFAGQAAMQIVTSKPSSASLAVIGSSQLPNGTLDFAFTGAIEASKAPDYFLEGYKETIRYAQLKFYAVYTPGGAGDVGTCSVVLSKQVGTTKSVRDTIAYGAITIPATSTYTVFTVPLTYKSGSNPDTATIIFTSSGTTAQAVYGSTLIVDSVAFSGVVLGVQNYAALSGNILAFPNPARENITLKYIGNDNQNLSLVEVFDATGRKAAATLVQNNQLILNTNELPAGLYIYNAYNESHELMAAGKFNVLK